MNEEAFLTTVSKIYLPVVSFYINIMTFPSVEDIVLMKATKF